jgi:hypothetical protein
MDGYITRRRPAVIFDLFVVVSSTVDIVAELSGITRGFCVSHIQTRQDRTGLGPGSGPDRVGTFRPVNGRPYGAEKTDCWFDDDEVTVESERL